MTAAAAAAEEEEEAAAVRAAVEEAAAVARIVAPCRGIRCTPDMASVGRPGSESVAT